MDIVVTILLLITVCLFLIVAGIVFFIFLFFRENILQLFHFRSVDSPDQTMPRQPGVPIEQFRPDPTKPIGIKFSQDAEGNDIVEEV